jgi:hypothetical protein
VIVVSSHRRLAIFAFSRSPFGTRAHGESLPV